MHNNGMTALSKDILWLKNLTKADASHADSAVMWGEMVQAGFSIPEGFVITHDVYFRFLHEHNLLASISNLLTTVSFAYSESVMQVSEHIKKLIIDAKLSEEFIAAVTNASNQLRSDTLLVTYADKNKTIKGEADLLLAIKEAWATMFDPKILLANHEGGHNYFSQGLAVVVQKNIAPEKSGMILTADPVAQDKNKLIIEIFNDPITHYTIDKNTTIPQQNEFIQSLAQLGKDLDTFFYFPQEITWIAQGDKFFITKVKPLQIHELSQPDSTITLNLPVIFFNALPVSRGIAGGEVRFIESERDFEKILSGDMLVIKNPNLAHRTSMQKAAGFIIIGGGRTSHAALLARELGIPAVALPSNEKLSLTPRKIISIHAAAGKIYLGSIHTHHIAHSTATHLYAEITDISHIEDLKHDHINGILLHKTRLEQDNQSIHHLGEKLSTICKLLPALPIIYHTSDVAEETEQLGLRGTFRYLHDPKLFIHEIEAIRYARNKLHAGNLWVMLPYVRTVHELREAKERMATIGLSRSGTFKIWMSVATPGTILKLDEFIQAGIDGIAINIDELTMLMLGIDPENNTVASAYDALDQSIQFMIETVIKKAHDHHIASAIYGKTLSKYPSLTAKLVSWGITGIFVAPKNIDKTRDYIAQAEKKLIVDTKE